MAIGALTWNLSLYLSEYFQLRKQEWWRQLKRGLKREFRDLDPNKMVYNMRGPYHVGSLAFGETPVLSVLKILQTLDLPKGSTICDLGAGRGLPCLVAAAQGYRAIGLEYFAVYTERAQRIAESMGVDAAFIAGNFLNQPLPAADAYLVSATAFPEETRAQLKLKLDEQARMVVAQDWILGPPWEHERMQKLPVSWGTAQFCYQRKTPDPEANGAP
ncbi:MAG: class I SAM-dependent methyltransferase [Candidatus Eremiobacteraeota bacterium]|nr:class I SAM-dependent methyltransferase [Candidatus Eremiobacteraeota bacterium]MCW5867188.1 class I SAM-dependent methyltransferase [Candidatus Eremiobacteraeota bacterium]